MNLAPIGISHRSFERTLNSRFIAPFLEILIMYDGTSVCVCEFCLFVF